MNIGQKILTLRQKLNITQKELADSIGITEATLSRYENGLRSPKGEIAAALAKALGVSTDYLLLENTSEISTNTVNEEKDIKKAIASTLEQLENAHDGLMFDGEPIDDETKELLIMSLERSMRLAKQLSKEKNK